MRPRSALSDNIVPLTTRYILTSKRSLKNDSSWARPNHSARIGFLTLSWSWLREYPSVVTRTA